MIANCYFLMISAWQCVPQITNTGGLPTTMLPLLVVVLVDGIFHVIEDLARPNADKEANSSITTRYDMVSRDFVKCHWFELEVGNIVKIFSRETIPVNKCIVFKFWISYII